MRKHPRPLRPKPQFLWQGLLIVLPAMLLAAACLYSLKQDQALADHEVTQQAQRLATLAAEQFFPRALPFVLPDSGSFSGQPIVSPEDDPVLRQMSLMAVRAACFVDANGALLYPPQVATLPAPEPLDLGELTPSQQDAWLAMEESWTGGFNAERSLESFIALDPPDRLQATARFRTAVALQKSGKLAQAVELMDTVRRAPRLIVGESGVQLAQLADLQLIRWQSGGAQGPEVDRLAAELIAAPSPMADAFWERMPASVPSVSSWLRVKSAHAQSRLLYETLLPAPEKLTSELAGETVWRMNYPVADGSWVLGVSLETLRATLPELERSLLKPDHLRLTVALGVEAGGDRPVARHLLASARSVFHGLPGVFEVFLADPAQFHAQQHARTMRFAWLIALSALAVLVGFFSAWRSFRREQQLGEMKTNFVSSVSHELRAPIASVRLMAEELQHGKEPDAQKLREYHRFIGQECRRLSAVIENVLDFARREQGRERFEFEPTDLRGLVLDTVALMRPYAAECGVHLEDVQLGAAEEIEADGHALQRALVNLIDNAIKHSPSRSTVTVGIEFAADRVFLYVEDRGPGIPREERDRIFERFYRIGSELRRETQGIGLGLSIVKHLAEVHGGRVFLRSEVGKGSRFTIELPLPRATLLPEISVTV